MVVFGDFTVERIITNFNRSWLQHHIVIAY